MQTPPKQNSIMPLITELLHFFCLKTIKKFLREDTITAETKKGERGWLIKSVGLGLQVCNDRGIRCVEVKEIREVPMERPCVPPSAGLTPREPPSRRSLSRLIKHLLCCYNSDGYGCRVHWLPRRRPLTSLALRTKAGGSFMFVCICATVCGSCDKWIIQWNQNLVLLSSTWTKYLQCHCTLGSSINSAPAGVTLFKYNQTTKGRFMMQFLINL